MIKIECQSFIMHFITKVNLLKQHDMSFLSLVKVTRPKLSEGGPHITNLIQGVPSEETNRHRQIEFSISITRTELPLRSC